MYNIGDEVFVIEEYDGNKSIKNKTGTIIDVFNGGVTIYFHKKIRGHDGNIREGRGYKIMKQLSEKYNTPIDNCWCIFELGLDKCITRNFNNKDRVKHDLFTLANC